MSYVCAYSPVQLDKRRVERVHPVGSNCGLVVNSCNGRLLNKYYTSDEVLSRFSMAGSSRACGLLVVILDTNPIWWGQQLLKVNREVSEDSQ